MGSGDWLRLFLIVVGVIILGATTLSLAKKRMTESFCIFWGIVSLLVIAAGIILRPVIWNQYLGNATMAIISLSVFFIVIGGLYFSVRISRLIRQATELAIQVSLLNQENEILLREVNKQNDKSVADSGAEHEEKTLIYN